MNKPNMVKFNMGNSKVTANLNLKNLKYLVCHHMAHPTWTVQDVHNYHRNINKWTGGIGYNYWVGFDGTIYECRQLRVGAHVGRLNPVSVGIGFQGNLENQKMTDAQLKSGIELLKWLQSVTNPNVQIVGHGDLQPNACPGRNFRMNELKEGIKNYGKKEEKEVKNVSDHWAKPYFDFLQTKGYNLTDEKFDSPLTRGEFFKIQAIKEGYVEPKTQSIQKPVQETPKSNEPTYAKPFYHKIATTDIIEVDPMSLRISVQDIPANRITLPNFVTGGYQLQQSNGEAYPLGILVSEGEIIQNRQPHGKRAGTLIVHGDGVVRVIETMDITRELGVWFAIGGCSILPNINMTSAGFTGAFSDIARSTVRPVMGYNPTKNKIIIAVRPDSTIERGQLTLKNLGCTMGITLDAGGSTVFRVDGKFLHNTTRQLHHVVTWS